MHTIKIINNTEFSLHYRKGQQVFLRGTESSSSLLFAGVFTRVTQQWTQARKTVFSHIKNAVLNDGQKLFECGGLTVRPDTIK